MLTAWCNDSWDAHTHARADEAETWRSVTLVYQRFLDPRNGNKGKERGPVEFNLKMMLHRGHLAIEHIGDEHRRSADRKLRVNSRTQAGLH